MLLLFGSLVSGAFPWCTPSPHPRTAPFVTEPEKFGVRAVRPGTAANSANATTGPPTRRIAFRRRHLNILTGSVSMFDCILICVILNLTYALRTPFRFPNEILRKPLTTSTTQTTVGTGPNEACVKEIKRYVPPSSPEKKASSPAADPTQAEAPKANAVTSPTSKSSPVMNSSTTPNIKVEPTTKPDSPPQDVQIAKKEAASEGPAVKVAHSNTNQVVIKTVEKGGTDTAKIATKPGEKVGSDTAKPAAKPCEKVGVDTAKPAAKPDGNEIVSNKPTSSSVSVAKIKPELTKATSVSEDKPKAPEAKSNSLQSKQPSREPLPVPQLQSTSNETVVEKPKDVPLYFKSCLDAFQPGQKVELYGDLSKHPAAPETFFSMLCDYDPMTYVLEEVHSEYQSGTNKPLASVSVGDFVVGYNDDELYSRGIVISTEGINENFHIICCFCLLGLKHVYSPF